ncbi:ParB/RepB/Spo0J family partition protein [Streptomyces chartreusis]|uniref:ParB/RepB/Spo0J family partition protein n=1 Tax=Streptomyces chartreusis TaxID=1969 RepID=A0A7H8TA29_STRCX|nr:ParB/RepB/Spo0J family partition protein [Streptomyces chartreusis]QKZ20355.1 ParB/RepB/Spo0J family partition protein [Streptomyces chartreusis]
MAGSLKRAQRTPQKPGAAVPKPAASADGEAPKEPEAPKFFQLTSEDEGTALDIALDDITPNPFNDRDIGDVTQLAESIDQDDLLQEITVMHTSAFVEHWPEQAADITTKYVLAFGERRWRAHKHLGRKTIPATLRNTVAPKIRRVLFAENFHRKQLSPVEEARKFRVLHVEEGMSYRQIVSELKLTGPNYVARRLELLELAPALQEIIDTEHGPGVTLARNIKARLTDPEEQIRAWELIRDEGLNLSQAVDQVRYTDPVPLGDTQTDEQSDGDAVPPGNTPQVPGQGQPPVPLEDTQTDEQSDGDAVPPGNSGLEPGADHDAPTPRARTTEKPQPGARKRATAADRDTAERNNASAHRDTSCRQLIAADTKLTAEQHNALFGRTLLTRMEQGPARTRAHRWLRDAGQAVFDINDTDSFFEAVLSSGQAELVNRVAIATALAAGEVRARDGRRQWDKADAEHVRLLIDAMGYVPETAWERAQLDKFGVPLPGASQEADPESIH